MRRPSIKIAGRTNQALAADPFVGTWKLNAAKSKGPRVFKSLIIKVEAQGDIFKWTYDSVHSDGKAGHLEWSGKYDGKDYPLKGSPEWDAAVVRRIDAQIIGWIDKKSGKEMAIWQFTVSKDGKTQSWTGNAKDAKGQEIKLSPVFEKQ
jgi:hypothetical protein